MVSAQQHTATEGEETRQSLLSIRFALLPAQAQGNAAFENKD